MTLPKINKNILLLVALIVIGLVAYFMFWSDAEEDTLLTVETNPALSGVGQELVIELNRLKSLGTVDKNFFSDPVFSSLRDFTQVVVPQPLGRSNPFAPLGSN